LRVPEFPPEADVLQRINLHRPDPHEGHALLSKTDRPRASTSIAVSKPNESMPKDTFFRNGERHEVYFVQDGEGVVRSE